MSIAYVALAIVALGFLIIVHEAGHYFVARWCGMRVDRFSIGFGPGILKHRSKKTGTIFQLAPIPFGGFVEIRGMNIAEDVEPDDKQAYPNRPAWQRFVTIFAGPATNYLSAIALGIALFTCHGVDAPGRPIYVGEVLAGYDAAGKLEKGDQLLRVDGERIGVGLGKPLSQRVADKKGGPLTITVLRGGKELDFSITPKPNPKKDEKGQPPLLLGVSQTYPPVDASILQATWYALKYPVEQTKLIAAGLYGIIVGTEDADPGGPVRIVEEFQNAFETSFVSGIRLLMMLSVYLGLFNLFPLPALDGGRLVFLGYEMVTRRRANPKIEAMVHMIGIMLLGIVMILVTFKDCKRLIIGT